MGSTQKTSNQDLSLFRTIKVPLAPPQPPLARAADIAERMKRKNYYQPHRYAQTRKSK